MITQEQLQEMTAGERAAFLQDNAYNVEEGGYFRRMTPEELSHVEKTFSEEAIKLQSIEDEFNGVKAEYKGKIDSKKEENNALLDKIKQKGEFKNGKTFLFDDQENNVMYIFDETGAMVNFRELRKEEKQTKINRMKSLSATKEKKKRGGK